MRLRPSQVSALCLAALSSTPTPARGESLLSGGVERHYELFRPEGAAKPRPAVFLLHGGAGTAEGMCRYTGFDSLAEEAGIVAVYPQGIERRWNDGRLPTSRANLPRDDQFLLDLVDHLSAIGLVDRRRVYIAGISNGGIMALQMACSHADRIAGIAVIAASLSVGFQCQPQRSLPVIFFNGTQDRFIPFAGGPIAAQYGGGRGSVVPVEQSLQVFARSAGCATRHARSLGGPPAARWHQGPDLGLRQLPAGCRPRERDHRGRRSQPARRAPGPHSFRYPGARDAGDRRQCRALAVLLSQSPTAVV